MQEGTYATTASSGKPAQRSRLGSGPSSSPPAGNPTVSDQQRIPLQSDGKAGEARALAVMERELAQAKALSHPLRFRILGILGEREASPKELAGELDEKLHTVMYHVDWLAGKKPANSVPLIELIDLDRRRGGVMHIWKRIDRPYIDSAAALELSRAVREDTTAAVLPLVLGDIRSAQKAGTFDGHPLRSLMRMHDEFDDQGMHEAAEAVEAYVETLKGIAGRSKNRIANGAEGFPVATETLVFQVPKLY